MSKRSFRIALSVVIATCLVTLVAGGFVVRQALRYPEVRRSGKGAAVKVEITRGMSFPQVAKLLYERGVIDNPRWFRLYAMHRGVTTRVRSGKYVLQDNLSPKQVLDKLLAGVPDVTVSVTIPEGLNMLEVFQLIDKAGVAKATDLEGLARDPAFLQKHGISGKTVEGYLFPETYRFRQSSDPRAVLDTMLRQYRIVWDQVRRAHAASIARLRKRLGWTDRDFLIMASMVEKEAEAPKERPRIAQVFINRLLSPTFVSHKLETDPTIRYGCTVPLHKSAACQKWDPAGRLHRAQLDDADNPYNTYQHAGMPPGPICNPGRAALAAAAQPDGSSFFYFVSRNNGTHVFSRTLAEQEKWVRKYQK